MIFTKNKKNKKIKNQKQRKEIYWNNIPTPCHKPGGEK
jgi:hypothetical protein